LSKIAKSIINIVGWIVLMVAFGSLGFTSDNPSVGVPVFLVFFLLIFALTYYYVKNHQKHQTTDPKIILTIKKAAGLILLLLALLAPYLVFRTANFPFLSYFIVTLITAILIALGMFGVTMINSSKEKSKISKLFGYLILIVISSIPAILMISYDSSYNALGTAYYTAVLISIFSWWGFSLFSVKE